MTNRLTAENPYGKLKLDELVAFEKQLGCPLPAPYRDYLVRFNGGRYERDIVKINETEGDTRIHHMYGLHAGPEYARLDSRLGLVNSDFLAICDDAFGNHFLIKLRGDKSGWMYFLDHEEVDPSKALTPVARDFPEFVENMISENRQMAEFRARDPAGYQDFQERLREMKRLRAEELRKK